MPPKHGRILVTRTDCCFVKFNLSSLLSLLQSSRQPIQALVQAVAGGGATSLDVPLSVAEAVETQLIGHLGGTHGVGKILLVGENQQDGLSELVFVQHSVQLVASWGEMVQRWERGR